MGNYIDPKVSEVVDLILQDYEDDRTVNLIDIHNQPDKEAITDVVDKLLKILYPGYYSDKVYNLMLIGVDRRDKSWNGNSDTMILISAK